MYICIQRAREYTESEIKKVGREGGGGGSE